MKITYKLLFSVFLFFFNVSKSQTPPQLIPPSPTAYSLGKYGDIPVSLSTGVPNISIPIYTLQNRDVSVDVSLSYHAGGVKVDELASFVGLGWSLNAGGVITRVVKGLPEILWSDGSFFYPRADFHSYNSNVSRAQYIADNNLAAASGTGVDAEADVFYFNFMGRSGKFYFDTSGHTILEKDEGLEITWQYVSSGVQKFVVKDEMGKIYEFSDYETTYISSVGQTVISGWYLTKITSPTGNVINFEYSAKYTNSLYERSYSVNFTSVFYNVATVTAPINVPYSSTNYSEIRLLKIKSGNGSIEFNYKNQIRQDYQSITYNVSNAALDEIHIRKADSTLLKKYKVVTSYFQANDVTEYDGIQPENYNFLNYRLRLDSVQEYASDNTSANPAFTFSYLGDDDTTTDDSYTLPYRLSPSQDHWGYFNHSFNSHMIPGKATSSSIAIPEWYQQFLPSGTDVSVYTSSIDGGADREVDNEAIKAGMLKEIHYPTGGTTQFFFEANDYAHNIGGVRVSKIISTPNGGKAKETDYTYSGNYPYNPKDYYFEAYVIANTTFPFNPVTPITAISQKFGVPTSYTSSGQYLEKFIKVTVQPQAILGGSNVAYYSVKESQPGNGYTISTFDDYADYLDREYLNESTQAELDTLDELFISEFIDPNSYTGYPTGFTVTKYLSSKDWPYPEIYSNNWKRGELTYKNTYDSNNVLLKSEHFTYFRKLKNVIHGFKVIEIPLPGVPYSGYIYSKYFAPNTKSYLKSQEVVQYDQNGQNPLTTLSEYFYDNDSHFQPTRTQTTASNGKKIIVSTVYPLDYADGTDFIDDMKDNHLLAYPIEQVKYLVDSPYTFIISGTVAKYNLGGKGLKEQDLKLETNTPVALSNFKFSNKSQGVLPPTGTNYAFNTDSRYKPFISYHAYDTIGNLLSISKEKDIKTAYLWGYNNQYPIAECINADTSSVAFTSFEADGKGGWSYSGSTNSTYAMTGPKSYLASNGNITRSGLTSATYIVSYWGRSGSANVNSAGPTLTGKTIGNWTYYEHEVTGTSITVSGSNYIDELRLYPKEARMKTFTYIPLVGIATECDVNNRILYYEYDSFNRLKQIKDEDGKIIKRFDYKYQSTYQD